MPIYPVMDDKNNVTSILMRINDITEMENIEKKLIQSEKLVSIGVLVSGIAHEINNLNSYISFNIPILKDYLNAIMPIVDDYAENLPELKLFYMNYSEFREDIFRLLDNVEHGSKRINSIISELKEFSGRNNNRGIIIPI